MTKTNTRIEWIDIAKGITILLVIFGHGEINGVLRGAIYSFHMPLFFILSCITYKLSENNDEFVRKTQKSFKHLIVPAILIFVFRTIIDFVIGFIKGNSYTFDSIAELLRGLLATYIVGSGTPTIVGDISINAIGIPWFLFALFLGRQLFDYIHLVTPPKTFVLSIICSIIGVCIGQLSVLPFSFDIALAILPLFLIGEQCNNAIQKYTVKILICTFVVWAIVLLLTYFISGTYLEFANRNYPLYPLCYICAVAGTLLVGSFSQLISNINFVSQPLKYIGKNSMYMLYIHCFDKYIPFFYNLTDNGNVNAIIRVLEDILIFIMVMFIIEKYRKHLTFKRK